jgi:hypothetical protein
VDTTISQPITVDDGQSPRFIQEEPFSDNRSIVADSHFGITDRKVNGDCEQSENRAMDKRADKMEISAGRVLQEMAKLAFNDPRKFFESDVSLKRILDLEDDTAACIASMEVMELFDGSGEEKHAYGLLKKIKIADKGQNLERLGRHLKLFTDKTERSGLMGVQLIHSIGDRHGYRFGVDI